MIEISKEQAIKVMEENLKILKECSDSDTFLLLSFDLKENKSLGRKRLDLNNGRKLVSNSKTFILNKDEEEDTVSVLSIYSALPTRKFTFFNTWYPDYVVITIY